MPLGAIMYPHNQFEYSSSISNYKDFLFHDLYYQEEGVEVVAQDTKTNIDHKLVLQEPCNDHHKQEDLHHDAIDMENHLPMQQRKRRRRMRNCKNKEEIESQRMTHIAVERNRRKQMNEYLAVLRSLMPSSYAQRGDQASIVGGAINYVKELEHILQSMEPIRATTKTHEPDTSPSSLVGPFSDFFTYPQYSTKPSSLTESSSYSPAEIEVTVAEGHANIKIMAKKKPKQLLKLVASLQSLKLTLLHLNVTTLDDSILYSITVKVEEGSNLNTVDDIATALNQIIRKIEQES